MAIKITTHNPALGIPFKHATDIAPASEIIVKENATKPPLYPTGPALWKELHLRALEREGQDDSAWMLKFENRIPCGECKRHFAEMLKSLPENYVGYFDWTVKTHNSVNSKLGKPILSLEQARKLYEK